MARVLSPVELAAECAGDVPTRADTPRFPPGHAQEDARLARQAAAGSRHAFGQLYARYAPVVHGVLLARTPRIDVEDLLQDVFLAAWRRIGDLRDPAAFGGWLLSIARHRATDACRRRPALEPLPADVPGGVPAAPAAEAHAALAAIRTLPDAYRETLMLRLVEGLTGPEIAERTGLTAGSVRVNLHRGMKLLREKLGLENGDQG